MKRLMGLRMAVSLLFILWLPLTALADVVEQIQAPNHLTLDPIVTNTGHTTIIIDAEVIVPQVNGLNVYPTASRQVTAEDIQTLCDFLGIDDSSVESKNGETPYPDSTREWGSLEVSGYYVCFDNTFWHGIPYGGQLSATLSNQPFEYVNSQYRGKTSPFLPDESMEACAYSRAEAEELATALAAAIAPELTMEAKGVINGSHWLGGWTEAELKASHERAKDIPIPTAYHFTFSRQIDGVPLYSVAWDGSDNEHRPVVRDEWLSIVISDEGVDSAVYWDPAVVGEPIQTHVELMPFEQIIDVAESILPLKAMSQESTTTKTGLPNPTYDAKETVYTIDRITLGYMRVLQQDDPSSFLIVPVWDFWGSGRQRLHYANGDWNDWSELNTDTLLTIHAMNGLVIDRSYGY